MIERTTRTQTVKAATPGINSAINRAGWPSVGPESETADTLLLGRLPVVEALLREFGNWDRSSWNDDENEYWTIFNCNPNETGKRVSVFIGWMMERDTAIEKIWIGVGGEGYFVTSSLIRPAKQGEADELLARLRTLIVSATEKNTKCH